MPLFFSMGSAGHLRARCVRGRVDSGDDPRKSVSDARGTRLVRRGSAKSTGSIGKRTPPSTAFPGVARTLQHARVEWLAPVPERGLGRADRDTIASGPERNP